MNNQISNIKYQIISFILISFFLFHSAPAFAQSTTPTPSQKPSIVDQISDLKDRIASRVAELKLVDKRGIVGIVQEVTSTQITVSDITDSNRFVDVDEITKFSSPSAAASFGISDLTKGTRISVLGLYNKQSRRITARFISVDTFPTTLTGHVATVDSKDFSFKISSEDGKQTTVDVETVTKTNVYTQANETEKAGFSKIIPGTRIFVIGYPDKKDRLRMVATRILLFPDLPKNPKVVVPAAQLDEDEIVPSTGSGKKLTPIR